MNDDLISRKALKKVFGYTDEWYKGRTICAIIDNAPTVEFPEQITIKCDTEEDEQKLLSAFRKAKLKTLIENERQKGEWNYGEDEQGQDGWFCSECGFFIPWYYQYYEKDIDFIREYKACPHCIAEMITYTGKDRDKKGGDNNGNT